MALKVANTPFLLNGDEMVWRFLAYDLILLFVTDVTQHNPLFFIKQKKVGFVNSTEPTGGYVDLKE
jgi:hypothetical protein